MAKTKLSVSGKKIVGLVAILCLIGGGIYAVTFIAGPAYVGWRDIVPLGDAYADVGGSLSAKDASGKVLMVAPVRDFYTPTGEAIYAFGWGINYTLSSSSGSSVESPAVNLHVEAAVVDAVGGTVVSVVAGDMTSALVTDVFTGALYASLLELPASAPSGSYTVVFTFVFDAQATIDGASKHTIATYTAGVFVDWRADAEAGELEINAIPFFAGKEYEILP